MEVHAHVVIIVYLAIKVVLAVVAGHEQAVLVMSNGNDSTFTYAGKVAVYFYLAAFFDFINSGVRSSADIFHLTLSVCGICRPQTQEKD